MFEILRHGLPTIESTPSQYQDLTFEKLLIYYGAKGIRLNEDTFKKNLGFYTYDGRYNILAQLLSDASHLPLRFALFAGESVPVNKKLSEIFLQLHISENTGRGVPKVVEKYGKDAYQFRENTILVTIPFRWIHAVDAENPPEEIMLDGINSEKLRTFLDTIIYLLS